MKKNHDVMPFVPKWLKKTLLIMRITGLLCLMCVMHVSAIVYSQEARVTLKMNNVTIEEVFNRITELTKMEFFYNNSQIDVMKQVDVNLSNVTIEEALKAIFKGKVIKYEISNAFVVILYVKEVKKQVDKQVLTGVVRDKKGVCLPGVTVMLKGSKVGVATDVMGRFRITLPESDSVYVLVFSFIGMKKKEVKVEGLKPLNVVMEEELREMEEVVVTGYQTVSRRDMVGAYKTVNAKDIMMPAYTSIAQMLQGRVAGMIVTNSSSRVGTSPKIQIRGTATLLGNTDPLWVVDGVIQPDPLKLEGSAVMTQDLETILGNQISWLNPQDIESITVLKDASATAIYGSKASNGVIVVTTKRGSFDRLSVSYTGNFSVVGRPSYDMFYLMNSQERVRFSEEAAEWGTFYGSVPIKQPGTFEGLQRLYLERDITFEEFTRQKKYLEAVNTDWLKLLTRCAFSHHHNVSVFGGSNRVTYNFSLGYNHENGQEIGNSNERYSGRLAVNARLRENVKLDVSVNGSLGKTEGFVAGVSPLNYAVTTSRAIPAYQENGDLFFYRKSSYYSYNKNVETGGLGYNIINERDHSGSVVRSSQVTGSVNFRWDMVDWLSYEFTGGFSRSTRDGESWYTEQTYQIANKYRGYDFGVYDSGSPAFQAALLPFGGTLYTANASQTSYNVQNKLLVSKIFQEDHRLNIMLAMEIRSAKDLSWVNTVWGYVPERGYKLVEPNPVGSIVPIGTTLIPSGYGVLEDLYNNLNGAWTKGDQVNNFLSWFGTFAYTYKDRYVVNVNIRNDVSNRFGQNTNKRFDPTYSFGVSWRVSEEPWMIDRVAWVSLLNLRVTYGIQGNVLTNKSPDLILKQEGIADVYNQYFSMISSIPNLNMSWERTKTWNVGLDLELFKWFYISAEYYGRLSNSLVSTQMGYEYGISSVDVNSGKIENSGVEVTLTVTPVKQKDVALSLSLNSSKNWNKTGRPVTDHTYATYLHGRTDQVMREGYPVGAFWSWSYAGVDQTDGSPKFNLLDVPVEEQDPNMDPARFMVYSGTKIPYFTGGLNLSFRYKSFTLNSDFALLLGAKKRLSSPYKNFTGGKMPQPEVNLSRRLLKRWKQPGDDTDIPGLVKGEDSRIILPTGGYGLQKLDLYANSDALVVDASFLRCRQLGLTWEMNKDWCAKVGIKRLALTVNVNNWFVIADKKLDGFDPELEESVMPKVYSFGINMGF